MATTVPDSRVKELMGIGNQLFSEKSSYDQFCQEIAENCYLERSDFTSQLSVYSADFGMDLMDSTPVNARETLGNFIEAVLRQRDWFKLGTGDEERDKKPANALALDSITKKMRTILKSPRSNYAVESKLLDMDYVAFGQNAYSWEESSSAVSYRVLKSHHPKNCAWMRDENDQVYAWWRRLTISARDYKAKVDSGRWRGSPLHQSVENAADKEPHKKFNLFHILVPADWVGAGDGPKSRLWQARGHEYASVYIDTDNQVYLHEAGSKVFNYGASRWRKMTGLPYGFSPTAAIALPDSRMLQALAGIMLESGEKAIDPPILLSNDLFTRDLNFYSGGATMVDLPDDMRMEDVLHVLKTSGNEMRFGMEMKADVRGLINEGWLLSKLYLPNTRDMTAYESSLRNEEFRRAALPFFSPIDQSYHGPNLTMLLDMEVLMGGIRPEEIPEELSERETSWTFDSPLNEAEGRKLVEAFQSSLQNLAAAAQIDETVTDVFELREATTDALRGGGAPPTWLTNEKKRKSLDEQAAAAQKLKQAAAIASPVAGAVADVSNAAMAAQQAGLTGAPAGA